MVYVYVSSQSVLSLPPSLPPTPSPGTSIVCSESINIRALRVDDLNVVLLQRQHWVYALRIQTIAREGLGFRLEGFGVRALHGVGFRALGHVYLPHERVRTCRAPLVVKCLVRRRRDLHA